jgi:hypothetical protein
MQNRWESFFALQKARPPLLRNQAAALRGAPRQDVAHCCWQRQNRSAAIVTKITLAAGRDDLKR